MSRNWRGKPPLGIKDTLAIAALQQKAATAVAEAAEECVALLERRDLSQGWKPGEEELTSDFQVLADLVNELLALSAQLQGQGAEPGLTVESMVKASWEAEPGRSLCGIDSNRASYLALEAMYL
jgi:hypothetical protein